ncbi:MAG: DNA polymerase III subunit gamma/tau [Burkholderiales bacterium]|nr:DNA polymerase III subunit gamma/tau [Burkholderiales bacterium]
MAYVVLARKYRPRNFAQMVGQEHVVQALTHALQQQRLHHAYLFTGTRGIGKTTVSRILAKSLNCTGPDGQGGITAEPCGVCAACTEIDADRYIDYIELDAASNRSIEEIRDLIERAAYKPGVGRYKVFMIDEAHQLTKDAFNALLKTLEEPPEYLKFVLATTDPEKMLPTVLSRCLQFNLRPMAPQTVREHLQRVLAAEGIAAEDAALRLLARAARGSMRDGLSLTDQAIAYGGGRIEAAGVRAMLGSVDRHRARALVEALARRDGAALLAEVEALRGGGQSAAGTLEEIAALLQQMAVEQAVPGALDAQDPENEDALAAAPLLAPDETQLLYSMALHGREELSLASDEYGALTMVLLRFLAFPAAPTAARAAPPPRAAPLRAPAPPAIKIAAPVPLPLPVPPKDAAIASRAEEATPAPFVSTAATASPASAPPAPPAPVAAAVATPAVPTPTTALGDRWYDLVKPLCDQGLLTALVRELATQSALRAVDERADPPRWTLVVEREMLNTPALRERLAAALATALGHPIVLEVESGPATDTPNQRDAAERQRRQAAAEAAIRDDPLVRDLLSQFKTARIVPGSIKPVQP